MTERFDAIVIGSGFGGAVAACRLSRKGMRVLILERGRRWRPADYPRTAEDAWIWDENLPQLKNGWIDLRFFKNMAVAQGAGVGGGSLVYANVSVEAQPDLFDNGWPPEITFSELKPYYETVGKMLNLQVLPDNQLTQRFKLVREGAEKLGDSHRFGKLPLAVNFSDRWHYGLEDPFDERHSEPLINQQGVRQGTCIHCGNCDIGCRVRAKNTLDFNYIALAEQNGAEVRPLHRASHLSRSGGEYTVHFDRIADRSFYPGTVKAPIVVLGAGSLGSTEILLRSRDQYRSLSGISDFLGKNWSPNGDFLTPGFYKHPDRVRPSDGPTITCVIDYLDGSQAGERFWIEDGGFPNVLGNYLQERFRAGSFDPRVNLLLDDLKNRVRREDPLSGVMPWFAQGIDGGNGRLGLKRLWYAPWRVHLDLDWFAGPRTRGVIEAIAARHRKLAEATGGKPWVPPTWEVFRFLITPHPLGGCNMSNDPKNGVVNHLGEVFGCPDLYVADGAILPTPIGRNPSRTIAALAERIAAHIE